MVNAKLFLWRHQNLTEAYDWLHQQHDPSTIKNSRGTRCAWMQCFNPQTWGNPLPVPVGKQRSVTSNLESQ
jgi:hypothetical protein